MKKKILLGLLVFVTLFTLTGCFNKQEITAEEFKAKISEKEFTVEEKDEEIDASILIKEYAAVEKDGQYEIDFYEFKDVSNAKEYFAILKGNLELGNKTGAVTTSVEIGNHQKYTLKDDGYYYVASRVSNTVIYVEAKDEYKDEIKDILDDLDY